MNYLIESIQSFKDYDSYTREQITEICNDIILKINTIFQNHSTFDLELIEDLSNAFETTSENKEDFAEVSTPISLLSKISNHIDKDYLSKDNPTFLDYSCGKGNIIIMIFLRYYTILKDSNSDKNALCEKICSKIYFSDINPMNVFITYYKLKELCQFICNNDNFTYNYHIGDSFNLDLNEIWNIEKINIIFVNPPFEDKNKRNTTPHKLWIDFTLKSFKDWLSPDGYLIQISPSSFSSPSSKILKLFREKNVQSLYFAQEKHFKNISIAISYYIIQNNDTIGDTNVNDLYKLRIDDSMLYIPNDYNPVSLSIHKKVMFEPTEKLKIDKDYVTCHNIRLKDEKSTLSKTKTDIHIYPIFHTNRQVWFSSLKQEFLDKKKVMWTRSGYTKPFYDNGIHGTTDLAYFVRVTNDAEGENLTHNICSILFKYIFKTAKWSGFGNDKVFNALPKLPDKKMNDNELFNYFNLTDDEILYLKDVS